MADQPEAVSGRAVSTFLRGGLGAYECAERWKWIMSGTPNKFLTCAQRTLCKPSPPFVQAHPSPYVRRSMDGAAAARAAEANVDSRAAKRRQASRQRARERERRNAKLAIEKQRADEKAYEDTLVAEAKRRARKLMGG